jgi:hypothetical protein
LESRVTGKNVGPDISDNHGSHLRGEIHGVPQSERRAAGFV